MVLFSFVEFTGICYGGKRVRFCAKIHVTLHLCFGGGGILLPNIKVWFIESHKFCLAGLI